jgi:hypothetical protein
MRVRIPTFGSTISINEKWAEIRGGEGVEKSFLRTG